jgi:hypothetical protein
LTFIFISFNRIEFKLAYIDIQGGDNSMDAHSILCIILFSYMYIKYFCHLHPSITLSFHLPCHWFLLPNSEGFFCFLKTGFHYVVQAGLELMILLP